MYLCNNEEIVKLFQHIESQKNQHTRQYIYEPI